MRKEKVERVLDEVCLHFQINREALISEKKARRYSDPRKVAMFVLYRHLPWMSYPRVADILKRDHTTVIAGVRRVESDITLREAANNIADKLEVYQ